LGVWGLSDHFYRRSETHYDEVSEAPVELAEKLEEDGSWCTAEMQAYETVREAIGCSEEDLASLFEDWNDDVDQAHHKKVAFRGVSCAGEEHPLYGKLHPLYC
jgi:hypothetical protein